MDLSPAATSVAMTIPSQHFIKPALSGTLTEVILA